MREIKLTLSIFIIASLISIIFLIPPMCADLVMVSASYDDLYGREMEISDSYFIQNMGQMDSGEILFYSRGGNIFFAPDGVLYRFSEMEPIDIDESDLDPIGEHIKQSPSEYHEWGVVLKYSFIGSNNVIPEGRDQCTWDTNYFKGNDPEKWYTDVNNYKEIVYPELWDGIDLVYRLKEGSIKYDLIVHSGANPSDIRIQIDGANELSINPQGDLVIGTEYWDILDNGLISYYEDGSGGPIQCRFELNGEFTFSIILEKFDKKRSVVIDPIIDYSTFIGGNQDDKGEGITIDSSGNVFITGSTKHASVAYPTTLGAYDITHNYFSDVFVTKMDSTGSFLLYSTFIGGSDIDVGKSVVIDTSGSAYITGYTYNATTNYPTTDGAYDVTHNGNDDVFVTKLDQSGSLLIYSTLIGGSGEERGLDIGIDYAGCAYITGYAGYGSIDYPTTSGAYDETHNSDYYDVFVTKLDSIGSLLLFSTFIGGSNTDIGYGIVIDTSGNAYITGTTVDGTTDYPTTSGAYDETHNGGYDVFVTALNHNGSLLIYSTYIGGLQADLGYDIEIDSNGNSYITGQCGLGYPTTSGAFDTTNNGGSDVFVTKLNSSGSSLLYSTLIGGSGHDIAFGIGIDTNGNSYITGYTYNATTNFPTTLGSFDITHNGKFDVFVTKLDPTGSLLLSSTFIGGSTSDSGNDIAVDAGGNAYITGYTDDDKNCFPTTKGAFDTTRNGGDDVFVVKLIPDVIPPLFGSDNSTISATTGEQFTFSIEVTDNMGVSSVFVEHWFGTNESINVSMTGSNPYTYSITIPSDSIESLNYIFHANDSVDNWNHTEKRIVKVVDNDRPEFIEDKTFTKGTTGDIFTFIVNVTDNIKITDVDIEYWYGNGIHVIASMEWNDFFRYNITNPSDSNDSLHYFFQAIDTSNNKNHTEEKTVIIEDNDKPIFIEDFTPSQGTTGDSFTFMVNVKDNIRISSVYVEYWSDYGAHTNISMRGKGLYTSQLIFTSNFTDILHYIFHAIDSAENWNHTTQMDINIRDNDAPIFGTDRSDSSVTTGGDFSFNIVVTDNIRVANVYLEYWLGSGSHSNVSMLGNGTYVFFITIPSNDNVSLHYIFHATDSSGNWAHTFQVDITIKDDDAPIFGTDRSDKTGTTGEKVTFRINVTDNIEVTNVIVEYWFGSDSHTMKKMSGIGPYYYSITIPSNSTNILQYKFKATDSEGNWRETFQTFINIIDNDVPVFGADCSDSIGTTGDIFTFRIVVTDNIEVTGVKVEYWQGIGTHTNASLVGNNQFTYSILIPSGSIDSLYYIFHTTDGASNWNKTSKTIIKIIDNDAPVLGFDYTDSFGTSGYIFSFKIRVTDNIVVSGVYVEYWYGNGSHTNVSMSGTGPYTYSLTIPSGSGDTFNYVFHATDSTGNWVETYQTVPIKVKKETTNEWIIGIVLICLIIVILIFSLVIVSGRKRQEVEE